MLGSKTRPKPPLSPAFILNLLCLESFETTLYTHSNILIIGYDNSSGARHLNRGDFLLFWAAERPCHKAALLELDSPATANDQRQELED